MGAHCEECQAFADCFGMSDEELEAVGRWHEDHPGWKISAEEQRLLDSYTGEDV